MEERNFIHNTKTYIGMKNQELRDAPFYYKWHEKGSFLGKVYRFDRRTSSTHLISSSIPFITFYISCCGALFLSESKLQNLWKFQIGLTAFLCTIDITSKFFEVYFKRYSGIEYIFPISDLIFWSTHYYLISSQNPSPSLFWNCLTVIPLLPYFPPITVLIAEKRNYQYRRNLSLIAKVRIDMVFDFLTKIIAFLIFGYFSGTLKGKFFRFFSGLPFIIPYASGTLILAFIVGFFVFERRGRQMFSSEKKLKIFSLILGGGVSLVFLYNAVIFLNIDFRLENLKQILDDKKFSVGFLTFAMTVLGGLFSLEWVKQFRKFLRSN